jgi:type I restriction enzyme M protein
LRLILKINVSIASSSILVKNETSMTTETHRQLASFIWSICNLLRGPYKRNEYRKVILPLTVMRRFDCLLAPTKAKVLATHAEIKAKPETVVKSLLEKVTGRPFYNLSKLDFTKLLDDPNQLAPNLNAYINGFSKNVREIMERFAFDQQIAKMAEKNLLYQVIKKFAKEVDLTPEKVDNIQMGYVFEELIRIGAEQSNEEAGEHFTPREVIKLMVNLLLSPEKDLSRSHVVKTIFDPACGTGGMLSVAEHYIRDLNRDANPLLYGQDWNDEAWAVCKSDMLIKGEDADNIRLGDSFTKDGFDRDADGRKINFDYMLANPPFGVEWKQQQRFIEQERDSLGYNGRFGAGTPRINDGSLLFLQHMLAKMRHPKDGGSRVGIVFNGSPLFTGDAGSGESNIRQWIIENDWLETVVALPEQLFYNTGISTYIWVLTNRKEAERKGKVQLIDGRNHWVPMEKSLGNKRRRIGDPTEERPKDPNHIADLTKLHGDFTDGVSRWILFDKNGKVVNVTTEVPEDDAPEGQTWKQLVVSKVFDNADFGYHKITVERPLRLNFQATAERIARLEEETAFKNLTSSNKKSEIARKEEIQAGEKRQEEIRDLMQAFAETKGDRLYKDRTAFLLDLRELDRRRGVKLSASEIKAVLSALGERDETAEICRDRNGNPEPDTELRDTENVPLKESIEEYFRREVLPHVPDAWIDHSKTKVGYEIPLNRHFYRYEPPRPLETIESEIKVLEGEIVAMLAEVTA